MCSKLCPLRMYFKFFVEDEDFEILLFPSFCIYQLIGNLHGNIIQMSISKIIALPWVWPFCVKL